MDRQSKIQLLKDIATGKKSITDLQKPIKVERLTTRELNLLELALKNQSLNKGLVAEMIQYYSIESYNRPKSISEIRGYSIYGDSQMKESDKMKAIAVKWYNKLKFNNNENQNRAITN